MFQIKNIIQKKILRLKGSKNILKLNFFFHKYFGEKDIGKIGLNFSDHFALADGIVKTDYELFIDNLSSKLSEKVVSAEELAIRWIETRTEKEMIIYDQLVEITHGIINEAFSTNVITPGVTSTNDVVWWMREKVK